MKNIPTGQLITVDHQPCIYEVLKSQRNKDGDVIRVLVATSSGPHPVEAQRVQIKPMTGDRAGVLAKPFVQWKFEQRDKHDADSDEYKRMTAEIECSTITIYMPVYKERKLKDGTTRSTIVARNPEEFDGAWWRDQVFEVQGIHKNFARTTPNAYIPLHCLYKVPDGPATSIESAA